MMEFAGVETGKAMAGKDPVAPWSAFPPNTVVGVLQTREDAAQTQAELMRAGFPPDAIARAQGEEGAKALDPTAEDGWLSGLIRLVQNLGDVRGYLESYAELVREGAGFIAARYDDEQQRDFAISVLRKQDARKIGYTTDWMFTSVL